MNLYVIVSKCVFQSDYYIVYNMLIAKDIFQLKMLKIFSMLLNVVKLN